MSKLRELAESLVTTSLTEAESPAFSYLTRTNARQPDPAHKVLTSSGWTPHPLATSTYINPYHPNIFITKAKNRYDDLSFFEVHKVTPGRRIEHTHVSTHESAERAMDKAHDVQNEESS